MAEELVWARERRSPRRQAPSVEQIVRTAIAIADAEGLPAVSMRRVATDLGSGTASLYRYIASRDELLDLMIDEVKSAEHTELTGDWRADLTGVAHQVRATLLRHPWLSAAVPGRPALGTNSLRRHEAALAAAAPLSEDITFAAAAVDLVLAYVFGTVTQELAELQAQHRSGMTKEQWQASVGPYIRDVIASGQYPQFTRRVVEGEEWSAEEVFAFGLGCVLDGVAARAPR